MTALLGNLSNCFMLYNSSVCSISIVEHSSAVNVCMGFIWTNSLIWRLLQLSWHTAVHIMESYCTTCDNWSQHWRDSNCPKPYRNSYKDQQTTLYTRYFSIYTSKYFKRKDNQSKLWRYAHSWLKQNYDKTGNRHHEWQLITENMNTIYGGKNIYNQSIIQNSSHLVTKLPLNSQNDHRL